MVKVRQRATGDRLSIDDTADPAPNVGTLTSETVGGIFGTGGGITYDTLEGLKISLGSGGNIFNIRSTHSGDTEVNAGSGVDTVNLGSLAGLPLPQASSVMTGIQGPVLVQGQGASDVLNLDNSGGSGNPSMVLTSNSVTGAGMLVSGQVGRLKAFSSGWARVTTMCLSRARTANAGHGVYRERVVCQRRRQRRHQQFHRCERDHQCRRG
jgi:hypothetical protein